MKKRGGPRKFQWKMFYFHRFWRLTPPYMLFLMTYAPLIKYWSDGPVWAQNGIDPNECVDSWWKNLFYVNNLIGTDHECMGWSWYLANDMQFFILSPMMFIPLYYSSIFGAVSCGFFLLVCLISTGVLSYSRNLYAGFAAVIQGNFDDIYKKPWTRVGPYAVGMFAGYILYRTDCKIRMPKIINLVGWTVATALALMVVYGVYHPTGLPDMSRGVAALYNATNRSAWAVAVCWVIVACATGHGGWINTLLSWKAIIPLSRLTYCAYLVHPVVMLTYYLSRRTLLYYTDMEISILFCGFLCLSYGFAFIVSLAYESPMMSLEKVLLGRGKNS